MISRLTAIFSLGMAACAFASPKPAPIFSDHMVLQRDKPVPIWGWANPGEKVGVRFAGQEKSAVADGEGYWRVVLDAMPASSEGRNLEVGLGADGLKISDVLVGEVWLCAGQSNMARTLASETTEYEKFKEYPNDAEYPSIRFFTLPTRASGKPNPSIQTDGAKMDSWALLSKTTAPKMMSIPFFFSKRLNKELGVPIGMVQVAVSGTPLTSWMARETFDVAVQKNPGLKGYDDYFAASEAKLAKDNFEFKSWAEYEEVERKWKDDPKGRHPGENVRIPDYPAVLYNSMIYPLAPLAIRGVLWHQGEGGPREYRERFLAMIAQWRKLFGQDFYFIFGSLTRVTSSLPPLVPALGSQRGEINEQFLLADQDEISGGHTVLVNLVDVGNSRVHWAEKEEAGHRMAKAAVAMVFGKPETVFTGPELISAAIEGSKVKLRFRHIGGGLVYQPSLDGISGFVLEEGGKDAKLCWAEVNIEGDTVTLSNPNVTQPVNAYYGWNTNNHETLFNKEGYTAYPFRVAKKQTVALKRDQGPALIELVNASKDVELNLSHVRREGYVFNLSSNGKQADVNVTVRARLPREWESGVVTIGGKETALKASEAGPDGYRYFEITVPADQTRVEVLRSEKRADFSGVVRF